MTKYVLIFYNKSAICNQVWNIDTEKMWYLPKTKMNLVVFDRGSNYVSTSAYSNEVIWNEYAAANTAAATSTQLIWALQLNQRYVRKWGKRVIFIMLYGHIVICTPNLYRQCSFMLVILLRLSQQNINRTIDIRARCYNRYPCSMQYVK